MEVTINGGIKPFLFQATIIPKTQGIVRDITQSEIQVSAKIFSYVKQ